MALLDRSSFCDYTNNQDYQDEDQYSGPYLNQVFAAVQDEIASYIKWQPALSYHDEVGNTTLCESGLYVGRYDIELKHKPLLDTDASKALIALMLTYPIALSISSQVSLPLVSVFRHTGQLYALASGSAAALAGISYAYGSISPSLYASGYLAQYYAGYLTGVNDPTPSGGGTGFAATAVLNGQSQLASVTVTNPGSGYTNVPILTITGGGGTLGALQAVLTGGTISAVNVVAPGSGYTSPPAIGVSSAPAFTAAPLPEDIRSAAVLLARERIAFDYTQNLNPANPMGGFLLSQKSADLDERYAFQIRESSQSGKIQGLGYGSPMAQSAERKLGKYVKTRTPALMGR